MNPRRHSSRLHVGLMTGALLLATACNDADATREPIAAASVSTTSEANDADGAARHPDVLRAEATYDDATMRWTFAVTLSSPYDTPERYADGWRVMDADGTVYGIHTLAHDHANEQPFTRRQTNVEIPEGVAEVIVEGRDQKYGFGGATVTVNLHTE